MHLKCFTVPATAGMVLLLVLTGTGENQFPLREAPTGFDNQTNGLVSQALHDEDRATFSEIDTVAQGLGPVFNGTSCAGCHSDPVSGGPGQTAELRAGHYEDGVFVNPTVVINNGQDVITGRSLINTFAICPQAQEYVPDTETITTRRMTVNTLGDGFVEAVDDNTFIQIAQWQRAMTGGQIHGQPILVDVLEAPGTKRVGRFGWKDQQASLLSFAADAYLNEQGITSRLLSVDVTPVCDNVADPEDHTGTDGFADIDLFARFMRASKAPPVDAALADTDGAEAGARIFQTIGCAYCHVTTLKTAPTGTAINGGTFTLPEALGDKIFHPYSDFLLHNIGTGDSIVQNGGERTASKIRTAPLWGLRTHSVYMHDGGSSAVANAIARHGGEATYVRKRYAALSDAQREKLLKFLDSL